VKVTSPINAVTDTICRSAGIPLTVKQYSIIKVTKPYAVPDITIFLKLPCLIHKIQIIGMLILPIFVETSFSQIRVNQYYH